MGLVTVGFTPTTPGVYTGKVRINMGVAAPSGAMGFVKEIPYTYTVADDPAVLAVYTLTQVLVTIPAGTTNAVFTELSLILKPGVTNLSTVVDYLTWEPAAAAHPNVNGWVFVSTLPSFAACFYNNGIGAPPDCLPAGVYTARIHAVVTDGAQMVDVFAPITMVVSP
jgi:hypothetical protein